MISVSISLPVNDNDQVLKFFADNFLPLLSDLSVSHANLINFQFQSNWQLSIITVFPDLLTF